MLSTSLFFVKSIKLNQENEKWEISGNCLKEFRDLLYKSRTVNTLAREKTKMTTTPFENNNSIKSQQLFITEFFCVAPLPKQVLYSVSAALEQLELSLPLAPKLSSSWSQK